MCFFLLQGAHRLTNGHPTDPIVTHQLRLAWKPIARSIPTGDDFLPQQSGELVVERHTRVGKLQLRLGVLARIRIRQMLVVA